MPRVSLSLEPSHLLRRDPGSHVVELPQHFHIILSQGLVDDLRRSPSPWTPGGLPAACTTVISELPVHI